MATRRRIPKTSIVADGGIGSVLKEDRRFAPSEAFVRSAQHNDPAALRKRVTKGAKHPVAYWEEQARRLTWSRPWTTAFAWKHPHAKWFVGGTINASVNCLDRHLDSWRRTKAAIIWEAESGEVRTLTYQQLHADVCRMANALTQLGIKRGDVVGI